MLHEQVLGCRGGSSAGLLSCVVGGAKAVPFGRPPAREDVAVVVLHAAYKPCAGNAPPCVESMRGKEGWYEHEGEHENCEGQGCARYPPEGAKMQGA